MMTKTRREFTEEFKREAVGLLESGGRPLMQVAKELGIQPSMLRNCDRPPGPPSSASSKASTIDSVSTRPLATKPRPKWNNSPRPRRP